LAISPPSDIVLDVARAVDPASVEAARAQLANRSVRTSPGGAFSLTEAIGNRPASSKSEAAEPFKRFEAMVLQTFIQNMLPKDAATVYGKGVAGDMWKSLLAEQLADVVAERGGIGISERVLGDHYVEGEKKLSVGAVSDGPDRVAIDSQTMLSTALVEEIQRRMVKTLDGDKAEAGGETLFQNNGG
jgi:Rod binding domain-containing protein